MVHIIDIILMILGYIITIITNSKVTKFRIEQLEKKVEKHNNIIERVFKCEAKIEELENILHTD